jgi:hypothetical protein
MDPREVMELRRALAEALCHCQVQPQPRTNLQRMLQHLLWTAFAGLDEDGARSREQAVRLARAALHEWQHFTAPNLAFDATPAV